MKRFPHNPEDQALATELRDVKDLAADALSWAEKYRHDNPLLRRELDRVLTRACRAHAAAGRSLTVALFGESQVGKSFLLSSLCGASGDSIQVKKPAGDCAGAEWAGSEGIPFLEYINQEASGQRETTGLVTRFTSAPDASPRHPGTFAAVVVSLSDIIDMLATGFRVECSGTDEVSVAEIDGFLSGFQPGSRPVNEHYRQSFLRAVELAQSNPQLVNHYQRVLSESRLLEFVRDLDGDLELGEWVRLASVFWGMGRFPAIDRYFEKAGAVLEKIHYSSSIDVPWTVVCRAGRDDNLKSVTSIEALESLFAEGAPRLTEVHYCDAAGRSGQTRLTVGEISVVTAELVLPVLQDAPQPGLIEKADLLDFPGSVPHSGEAAPGPDQFQADSDGFAKASYVFRRGKLARLFENYCAARDISVLLQCADERNPTAMIMPGQLLRWIKTRYPRYPEISAAEQKDPSLFLVRTKADLLFKPHVAQIDSGNEGATGEFIQAQQQFLERALKPEDCWFSRWAGIEPFNNLHFVYRPQMFARTAQTAQSVERERRFYDESNRVNQHVRQPRERWEAFAPPIVGSQVAESDGGVSFLVGHVVQKVEPVLKREELSQEKMNLIESLRNHLPSPVATELDQQQREAAQAAHAILDELRRREHEYAFGKLLQRMTLPDALAAKSLASSGDVTDTVSKVWRDHVLSVETVESDGLPGLSRLTDEVGQFKQKAFRSLLRTPAYRQLIGGLGVSSAVSARVVARAWNALHIELGSPVPLQPRTQQPISIGEDIFPWRRLFAHWEEHLPKLFSANLAEQSTVPPGNTELLELNHRLNSYATS